MTVNQTLKAYLVGVAVQTSVAQFAVKWKAVQILMASTAVVAAAIAVRNPLSCFVEVAARTLKVWFVAMRIAQNCSCSQQIPLIHSVVKWKAAQIPIVSAAVVATVVRIPLSCFAEAVAVQTLMASAVVARTLMISIAAAVVAAAQIPLSCFAAVVVVAVRTLKVCSAVARADQIHQEGIRYLRNHSTGTVRHLPAEEPSRCQKSRMLALPFAAGAEH